MVDFGIQSYWLSHHPWVVPEPFTPEPCETYSKADLDEWAAVIKKGATRPTPTRIRARLAARAADRPDAAHGGHGGPGPVGLHVARLQEEV